MTDMRNTLELTIGQEVLVDHEWYTVGSVEVVEGGGDAQVELEGKFGTPWVLEVGAHDLHEPLWETRN